MAGPDIETHISVKELGRRWIEKFVIEKENTNIELNRWGGREEKILILGELCFLLLSHFSKQSMGWQEKWEMLLLGLVRDL